MSPLPGDPFLLMPERFLPDINLHACFAKWCVPVLKGWKAAFVLGPYFILTKICFSRFLACKYVQGYGGKDQEGSRCAHCAQQAEEDHQVKAYQGSCQV